MPSLCRGRLVWVEVSDPQGRNVKCRPAVIVTPTEDIVPDGQVTLVAVTARLDAAPPEVQVALPWHPQGQTKTQLTKRSVAVCSWLFTVPVANIQSEGGIVPDREMLQLFARIGALPTDPTNPSTEPLSDG